MDLKNGLNEVVFYLRDKSVNKINPHYTFKIYNKGTREEFIFTCPNTSPVPNWDRFEISFNSNYSDPYNGEVPFRDNEMVYWIYEMANENDLNISDYIKIVDNGIMSVGTNPVNRRNEIESSLPIRREFNKNNSGPVA